MRNHSEVCAMLDTAANQIDKVHLWLIAPKNELFEKKLISWMFGMEVSI